MNNMTSIRRFKRKRLICFIASLIIIACNGFQYGLSVFQIPLSEKYGWSITSVAAAFSVMSIIEFFAVILLSDFLKKKLGLKKFMIVGGVLFGGGILCCAFIKGSLLELYLYQGLFMAVGNAIIYPGLSAYVIQIYPEKSGFANGLLVAFFACGPVVWSPLASLVIRKSGSVNLSFVLIGTTMLALLVVLPLLLQDPPEKFAESLASLDLNSFDNNESKEGCFKGVFETDKMGMLKKPEFYLFYTVFCIGIMGGTMILTQGATLAEKGMGVSAAAAAAILGGLNIGNAVGRLCLGTASDKIGIMKIVKMMFGLYIVCFMGYIIFQNNVVMFISMMLSMIALGGFCALLAPTTKYLFGLEYLDENFTIVYSSYAVAGIAAPFLVAKVNEVTGSYLMVFMIEVVLALIGLLAAVYLERRIRKIK